MRSVAALHPLALALLVTSLAIALAVAAWAPWSGRAPWVAAWGVIAYLAVAVLARTPGAVSTRAAESSSPAPPVPAARTNWTQLTEEALRHMRNPAALASSGLLASLPRTLAAVAADQPQAASGATAQAPEQALRLVLEAAIARMRQDGATEAARRGDAEALAFAILHEEYVLGHPNTQIMTRHSISESTFHRHRRDGIRALADELARQEQIARA